MKGIIDIVVNLFTPFEVAHKQTGFPQRCTCGEERDAFLLQSEATRSD